MGKVSPEMRKFLQSWLDWTERDAPHLDPYPRDDGLCFALYRHVDDDKKLYVRLHRELKLLFDADGLDRFHPFTGTSEEYYRQSKASIFHECPKRLAWVKEKLS